MPLRPKYELLAPMVLSLLVSACSARVLNEDGPGWSLAENPASFQAGDNAARGPSIDLGGAFAAATSSPSTADNSKSVRDPVAGKSAKKEPASVADAPAPTTLGTAVRKVKSSIEPAKPSGAATSRPAGPSVTSGASSAPAPKLAVAPVTGTTSPAGATTAGSTAVVEKGDTLHALSVKYKVPVKLLMSANNLSSDRIFPGQKLMIPTAQ